MKKEEMSAQTPPARKLLLVDSEVATPDPLYEKLSRGHSHSTQVMSKYPEFRLGQGDPLVRASIDHERDVARKIAKSPKNVRKSVDDIHLIQKLSPLGGMGINDVVHIGRNSVVSLPCLPFDPHPDEEEDKHATASDTHPNPQHHFHSSMLGGGTGLGDSLHLPDGDVIRVPILPSWNLNDSDDLESEEDSFHGDSNFEEHLTSSPLSGMGGMTDIVHLPDGTVVRMPILPFNE